MPGSGCQAPAPLRAGSELIMYPQVRLCVWVQLAHSGKCARITIQDDVFYTRDLSGRQVGAVWLGTVVLHDEGAECIRYPGNAGLCTASGLLAKRTCVVRPQAGWVIEQHGAH